MTAAVPAALLRSHRVLLRDRVREPASALSARLPCPESPLSVTALEPMCVAEAVFSSAIHCVAQLLRVSGGDDAEVILTARRRVP